VDSKASEIALKGVKGDKMLEGLSTIVDKAIDKLPTETLNRLLIKPATHMAGRMTAEGIQEGPIQQGLQHIAANQNDLSKLQDREVLKDIYVNGVIGALSVHGMRVADVGSEAAVGAVGAIKGGKSKELIDKAKGMAESAKDKVSDVVSAPEDVANAVSTNHPTPMTDRINELDVKEGINMLRVGVSPYIGRIGQILSDNENVSVYACHRSISKARSKEGKDIVLMPQAVTAKTGQELITERLEKGWIYIKV